MTDSAKSILEEETSKLETKSKRGSDVEDADVTVKKFKTEASANETGLCTARNLEAVNGEEELKVIRRGLEFEIEADAAEDKGSRHTMEDAWVLLLDASLDFPGKLRFLVVRVIYYGCIAFVCAVPLLSLYYMLHRFYLELTNSESSGHISSSSPVV